MRSVGGDAVPILDYPALVSDPQVQSARRDREIDHPTAGSFSTVAPVVRFSQTPTTVESPPPTLGQHTDEVLKAAGYNDSELRDLHKAGIIA